MGAVDVGLFKAKAKPTPEGEDVEQRKDAAETELDQAIAGLRAAVQQVETAAKAVRSRG